MKSRLLIVIAAISFTLIASPSHAQILGQNLKVFVGYSNLQAEGFSNQNTVSGFPGADFFRNRTTLHGVNASITGSAHGIGVTGDFSFNRNSQGSDVLGVQNTMNTDLYYFMAGPSFHYNGRSRVEPFARILAGGAHTRFDVSNQVSLNPGTAISSFEVGSTNFAMGVGGGLDLRIGDGPYRLRLIQVDYAPVFLKDKSVQVLQQTGAVTSTLEGQRMDNVRFSVGFVF